MVQKKTPTIQENNWPPLSITEQRIGSKAVSDRIERYRWMRSVDLHAVIPETYFNGIGWVNAILEGHYSLGDDWHHSFTQVTHLPMPEGVTFLVDREKRLFLEEERRYVLYGRTDDFESMRPISSEGGGLELAVDILKTCEIGQPPQIVCMIDGRVFVRDYLKNMAFPDIMHPSILQYFGGIFRNRKIPTQ